jgi:hypothetical protein
LAVEDLATTAFLDAGAFATGFGATFAFTAVLAFAADFAAGFAADFLSALRATEATLGAALDNFDFAGAFLDFEAVLAMVLNQSARGNDREMCRVTPRFRDVAQAARRYRCR